jgi:sortase A
VVTGGVRRALAVLLLGLGAWQGGQGLYIEAKARLAQYLVRRAWDEARGGAKAARPWPWADTEPVARLIVPGEGLDLIVLAGASGRTLAFGPGHLSGTPLPGEPGNAVVSGHRDTHFAFLAQVAAGDELLVERRDGTWRRYLVTGAEVVDKGRLALLHDRGDTRLTLVTCFPFGSLRPGGPLRYVVTARLLEAPPARHSFRTCTSSWTAAADFWSAAFSSSVSLISKTFSIPSAPSWAGTPTYRPRIPNSPSR